MATKRVTISVPIDVARRLKSVADAGSVSVSEYVTKALTRAIEDEESREAFLAFSASVPKSAEARRWAKEAFEALQSGKPMKPRTGRQRRGKAAA